MKPQINSEELEILVGFSENTQRSYRGRRHNHMPYSGGGKGAKLLYNKQAVTEWINHYL